MCNADFSSPPRLMELLISRPMQYAGPSVVDSSQGREKNQSSIFYSYFAYLFLIHDQE